MKDIDFWAHSVDELENGIALPGFDDKNEVVKLADYNRLTPNKLVKLLQDNIKTYDRGFNFKFINAQTGESSRNVFLKVEVDDVSEEIKLYYDFM